MTAEYYPIECVSNESCISSFFLTRLILPRSSCMLIRLTFWEYFSLCREAHVKLVELILKWGVLPNTEFLNIYRWEKLENGIWTNVASKCTEIKKVVSHIQTFLANQMNRIFQMPIFVIVRKLVISSSIDNSYFGTIIPKKLQANIVEASEFVGQFKWKTKWFKLMLKTSWLQEKLIRLMAKNYSLEAFREQRLAISKWLSSFADCTHSFIY